MGARGPIPALVDNDVLRAWWVAGDWAKIAPVLEHLALGIALRCRVATDDAADIAQNTLIRCWRTDTVPDNPTAYIGRVARNLALDHFKRSSTKYEVRDDADAHPVATDSPLDALMWEEARQRLRLSLRLLPEHLRRPLVLHVFHGKTMIALAAQFGSTEGAMKMRMVRARAALRHIYEDDARPVVAADLKLSVHAKQHGSVEVRAFVPFAAHEHRIGTWCLPVAAWQRVRVALVCGFAASGMGLVIDDTHATRQASG